MQKDFLDVKAQASVEGRYSHAIALRRALKDSQKLKEERLAPSGTLYRIFS